MREEVWIRVAVDGDTPYQEFHINNVAVGGVYETGSGGYEPYYLKEGLSPVVFGETDSLDMAKRWVEEGSWYGLGA